MDKKVLVGAALASVMSLAVLTQPVMAADAKMAKEKCFGIAAAGKNDCAAVNGAHSCAGQSTKDNDMNEWKYVKSGTCTTMGGMTKAPAKS